MKRAYGFTIVELLIVIVVIAILAAISVAAYTNITDQANDTAVKSDLGMIGKKFEVFRVDNNRYPNSMAELKTLGVRATESAYMVSPNTVYNLVGCVNTSTMNFSVVAISKSGKRFYISSVNGLQEYTGTEDWSTTSAYASMCSNTLAGSSYLGGGSSSAYYNGWRHWSS